MLLDNLPSPGDLVQDSDGIASSSRNPTTSTVRVSAATKVLTRLHTATTKVKAQESRHRRASSLGQISTSSLNTSPHPNQRRLSTITPTRALVHTCSSASLAAAPSPPPQPSSARKSVTTSPLSSSSTSSSSTSLLSLSPSASSTSASFSSLASSTSPQSQTRPHTPHKSVTYPYLYSNNSDRSPKSSNGHTLCTPLRSNSTTPKPRSGASQTLNSSPLFQRLLQPFVRSPSNAGGAISTPTPTTFSSAPVTPLPTTPTNPDMSGAYNHQNNNLPATPTTPLGTPSRSERLLRDTLMRDGVERNNASNLVMNETSAYFSPGHSSAAKLGHKRRHSEVPLSSSSVSSSSAAGSSASHHHHHQHLPHPYLSSLPPHSPGGQAKTSPNVSSNTSVGAKRERERERYTGSFLFRTAMSNPGGMSMADSPEPEERDEGSSQGSSAKPHSKESRKGYYGGDAEGGVGRTTRWRGASGAGAELGYQQHQHSRSASLSPSPVRRRLNRDGQHQHQQSPPPIDIFSPQFQFHEQQQQKQPRSPQSPRSPHSQQHPKSTHHTPQSPRHSPQLRHHHKEKGSPLILTPHEQVLRARLERVLEVGRVVERGERARSLVRAAGGGGGGGGDGLADSDVSVYGNDSLGRRGRSDGSGGGGGLTERSSGGGSGSREHENEVRDEEDGWPWREGGRGSAGEASGSSAEGFLPETEISRGREMTSSPVSLTRVPPTASPPSSMSPTRTAQTQFQSQQPPRPQHTSSITQPSTPARAGFALGHTRTRSKTETTTESPVVAASRGSAVNSPRRNTTMAGSTPTKTPSRSMSVSVSGVPRTPVASGLASRIPVAVKGDGAKGKHKASRNGAGEGEKNQNEEDDEELRLLTPPPTPPFTARVFSLSGKDLSGMAAGGGGEQSPSPYKTQYPAGVQNQDARTKSQVHAHAQARLGVSGGGDGPRRPANLPLMERRTGSRRSSSCGVGLPSGAVERRQGYFPPSSPGSGSAGSGSSSPEAESARRSHSIDGNEDDSDVRMHHHDRHHQHHHQHHPTDTLNPHGAAQRPAFNVRKASERCRAIEGYVSFASVEGLGEPPGAAFGDETDGADNANKDVGGGNGAGGVLGAAWRRLLGVAAVSPASGVGGSQEGVVL